MIDALAASREGSLIYLEAVEFCGVSDVGEMVHVFEVPVVCLSRGQHGHPAKLMSNSLLQIWNHAGACEFKNNTINSNNNRQQSYITADTFLDLLFLVVSRHKDILSVHKCHYIAIHYLLCWVGVLRLLLCGNE